MAESYLVLFDADHIKEYVFATGRLKEIRGASERVRSITNSDPVKLRSGLTDWSSATGEGLIYAGGGAGALLFKDQDRARSFCDDLERGYRHATRGATLTAVMVEVTGDAWHAQAQAAYELSRRKAERRHAETIPGGGALRFCASDRRSPASVRAPEPDQTAGMLVSESTALKRQSSYRYRQSLKTSEFWQAFQRYLSAGERREWDAATASSEDWSDAISVNQDLSHIGAQAIPRGYVALVYADGDRIGSTLKQIVKQHGFDGYQKLSAALTKAANQATAWALAAAYQGGPQPPDSSSLPDHPQRARRAWDPRPRFDPQTGRWRRFLPFEVITIGGDDIILICTAEQGLQVAIELSRKFGEVVNQELRDQGLLPAEEQEQKLVSASVGVVIAHDSMPIVQLQRRGADLLKSAKRRAAPGAGGIDFHVVTTPSLDRISTVRAQQYAAGPRVGGEKRQTELTSRPYSLATADTLLRHARRLARVLPNSKRADLYAACRDDRILATLSVLAAHARLRHDARLALIEALRDLDSIAYYPFGPPDGDGVFHTALPDLLEVMEYCGEAT